MGEVEWSDFKVILALSRGGSIAGAGRILGVDSSTISRRLAAAEEALGACLVLRGGREFAFTPEGKTALETALAIEVSVVAAKNSISSAKKELEGVVKISCTGSVYHFLVLFVEEFTSRNPKLHIEISDADNIVNLAKGEADIALRMVPPSEPDLIGRKAFEVCWYIYASQDYAKNYGLPETHEDLRKHRLVLYTVERLHIPGFGWLEQFKGHYEPARVTNPGIALRSIIVGAGISALPFYWVSENLKLIQVFSEPVVVQPAYLVYHESQRNSARLRAIVDGLVDFFERNAVTLTGRGVAHK